MAFKIDIELQGLYKAIEQIKLYEVEKIQAIRNVVNEAALNIQGGAKRRVPTDTSRLKNSIIIEPVSQMPFVLRVGSYVEYAKAVEFGTGIHSTADDSSKQPIVIKPKNKKALYWKGAKHPVKQVVQEGQRPRPYLFPAWEEERPAFKEALKEALK